MKMQQPDSSSSGSREPMRQTRQNEESAVGHSQLPGNQNRIMLWVLIDHENLRMRAAMPKYIANKILG